MSTKKRGKKETKQESPTQDKVVDPISLADLENIYTRKGKYPTRPPPFGQLTWEEAKREKEEKLKKLRKERSPSTVIPPYIAPTIKPQLYPTPSLSTEHAH